MSHAVFQFHWCQSAPIELKRTFATRDFAMELIFLPSHICEMYWYKSLTEGRLIQQTLSLIIIYVLTFPLNSKLFASYKSNNSLTELMWGLSRHQSYHQWRINNGQGRIFYSKGSISSDKSLWRYTKRMSKWCMLCKCNYRKVSNIRRTLVGNKIVDNSDVVGATPVGAAPTTSSFST